MMVYPKILGPDVLFHGGFLKSSGMDIELFVGMTIVILSLVAIILLFKKIYVEVIFCLSVLCFLYAANAHIPFLSKLIYKLPLLGNFRVPSRILFIFIFFIITLAGLGTSYLRSCKNKSKYLTVSLVIYAYPLSPVFQEFYDTNSVFIVPILLTGVTMIILSLYVWKRKEWIFTFSILVITSVQTMPYFRTCMPIDIKQYDTGEEGLRLKEVVQDGTLWYPSKSQTSYFQSAMGFNKGMSLEVSTLNSYVSINNPNIYRFFNNNKYADLNSSGIYTWFPIGETNLIANNHIISMFGINVVADMEELVKKDGRIYNMGDETTNKIFQLDTIDIPNKSGEVFSNFDKIALEDNTFYKINFEADSISAEDSIFVDFYGNQYDNLAQDFSFHIEEGRHGYTGYIFSGDIPDNEQTYYRIVGMPYSDISIKDFEITKMDTEFETGVYTKIYEENGYTYYRNNNAFERMYFVNSVENIESLNKFFESVNRYDFRTTAYVEGVDTKTNLDIGNIEIISENSNSFAAKVNLESEGFLSLVQNYFPGWKVYIDDKESRLYTVNGINQGVFVPKGEHIVKFGYTTPYFSLSLVVSIANLLFIVIGWFYTKKYNKFKLVTKKSKQ